MATTYLSRTNTTGTSTQKGTISAWIKGSEEPSGNNQTVLASWSDANNHGALLWNGSDKIDAFDYQSGYASQLQTNAVLRDSSAWYHIVYSWDTTLATADDRQKIYINGVEQTYSTRTNYSQNAATSWNANSYSKRVGALNSSSYFSGSMTHVHFIDGLQYQASDFGETDSTSGIWIPKTAPSVTYGTNGFFLKMENSVAMGTDSSGESNTFTVSGTLTQNVDTPSNNFATFNPLDTFHTTPTFTNGNTTLSLNPASSKDTYVPTTLGMTSGKYYAEAKFISGVAYTYIGITDTPATASKILGDFTNSARIRGDDGVTRINNVASTTLTTWTTNDIIGIGVDLTNLKIYYSKNGVWMNSADPSAGTGGLTITAPDHAYFFAWQCNSGSTVCQYSWNFGQGYFGTTAVASAGTAPSEGGIFEYDCPTGFQALCTKGINSF